jgi:hypothetical protein
MNQVFVRFFAPCAMTFLFVVAACLLAGNGLAAQSPAIEAGATSSGLLWKDQATMQQIVQDELAATNTDLAKPNLTDWSTAMLEAYKSLLTFTQSNMAGAKDMGVVLDDAYAWIKTEVVADVKARQMVLDDMKEKQRELMLKLTFN